MLYSFELQLLGAILLTVMLVAGIAMWYKRRKSDQELSDSENSPNL